MCCSSKTLEEKPRKKLIVKICYPSQKSKPEVDHDSDSSSKRRKIQHDDSSGKPKPTVTCYWVDASSKHSTTTATTLSHPKTNYNVAEYNKNIFNNHVSETSVKETSQLKEDSTITTSLLSQQKGNVHSLKNKRQVSKTAITAVSNDQRYPKVSSFAKETSRLSEKLLKESLKNAKGSTTMSEQKSDAEKAKKKPMERLKRMRCWVILNKTMEGRDGWVFKDPIDSTNKKSKPMGLKDVMAKLRVYSSPEEFAYDMRHVFSNVLSTNPPRSEIYKVAKRLCDNFDQRWKSLNDEWAFEERRLTRREGNYSDI